MHLIIRYPDANFDGKYHLVDDSYGDEIVMDKFDTLDELAGSLISDLDAQRHDAADKMWAASESQDLVDNMSQLLESTTQEVA
tara:strand:+ start:81 stop:329 length:249 start_codon:yes stop_codon:yes gene_type:complete